VLDRPARHSELAGMTSRYEAGRRAALVAGSVAAVAVSVGIFAWTAARAPVPSELAAPKPIDLVQVETVAFADSRTATLTVSLREGPGAVVRADGMVTNSTCSDGGVLRSGEANFFLNGQPLVNLHSSAPLWRVLVRGDHGADVGDLQQALVKEGFRGAVDGVLGEETIGFFNEIRRRQAAHAEEVEVISPESILWLDSEAVTVDECLVPVGTSVGTGTALASERPEIGMLRVADRPDVLPEAPRELTVDGVRAAVSIEGDVDSAKWEAIASTGSFAEYSAHPDEVILKGEVRLAAPIDVAQVPPSAIFGISGGSGCVTDGHRSYSGALVSAELGFTLMTFDKEAPTEVIASPPPGRECR